MGGEYLVWEGNENLRGFRDFRGFCGIGQAQFLYMFNEYEIQYFGQELKT